MFEIENKKLVSGIVLGIGCLILIIGLLNGVLTSRTIIKFNEDKGNGETVKTIFDEDTVIKVPEINGQVTFKEVKFIDNESEYDIYEDKYFVGSTKVFDFDGNLILNTFEDRISYKNGVLVAGNKIYDMSGNLLLDVGNEYIYEDDYVRIGNKIYNYNGELLFDGSNYDDIIYDEKYIIVVNDGKCGLIDNKGNVVLPIEYDIMSVNSDTGVFYSKKNSNDVDIYYVYNLKSKKEYGPYVDITYLNDRSIIVYKYLGNIEEVECWLEWLDTGLYETYALNLEKETEILKNELRDYYIKKSFFTDVKNMLNNYIIANNTSLTVGGRKYGIFDSNFNEVVPFKYDEIEIIEGEKTTDKYFELTKSETVELMNSDLKKILKYTSSDEIYVYDDLIVVSNDNYNKYYNKKGEYLFQVSSERNDNYLGEGRFLLADENNRCSYINVFSHKKEEIDIDYSICSNYSYDDYLMKESEIGLILFNKNGERIFGKEYVSIDTYDNYCLVLDEENKYYVINYQEEKLIDEYFYNYTSLNNGGVILIGYDDKKYYFNYN